MSKEGFWSDVNIPKPDSIDQTTANEIAGQIECLEKIGKQTLYRGLSHSRITGELLGNAEYSYEGWCWPGDYGSHYIRQHRCAPSNAFQKFLDQHTTVIKRYNNPTPVVVVLACQYDTRYTKPEILLTKREIEPVGKWCLPGGYINEGETAEQAAARELFEETGIRQAEQHMFPYKTVMADNNRLLIVCATNISGNYTNDFMPNDEVSEIEWVGVKSVGKDFAFPIHKMLVDEQLNVNLTSFDWAPE